LLRITTAVVDGTSVLKVEGKLLAPWVPELLAECDAARQSTSPIALDLSHVSFADAEGLSAIRNLLRRGISLRSCSGFVNELLHTEVL
jgi:anti-anti-sigma regulatory factor